jgi:glycerol-3-phosphate dehydrogenase (NAD(P)+)
MDNVAVLGAGSWGTALAIVLADNGHNVRLWGRREEQVLEINEEHRNEKYLPGVVLPENIKASVKLEECIEGTDILVLVTPTKAMRDVLGQLKDSLTRKVTIVHASKGIEPGTYKRISEIIEEELPSSLLEAVVVLSGPSHAEEVSLRQPTTVTVSSENTEVAEKVQDLFINQNFRVYTNPDVIGVELGGALKNIIALGAGLSDGLGYGDNAKAALITRGLAEIARLGTHMGANPLTFSGLTGIGDLIVTCTSVHSRNWRAGNMLGKGMALNDVLENMGMVVEGVRTTQAAYELSKREQVEMPITQVLYDVLFNNKAAKQAVDDLMQRSRTHEVEDVSSLKS